MATATHLIRQEEPTEETGIQHRAVDPVTPFLNQKWLNTTENRLKWYDGSDVRILSEGANTSEAGGGSTIDWEAGNMFNRSIAGNTTFTFANVRDGQMVHIAITNTSGGNITVGFGSIQNSTDLVTTIIAGRTVIYTFGRFGGNTVCLTPVRNEAFYGA